MRQRTVEQVENDIEIVLAFLSADLDFKNWTRYVSQYHVLSIELCNVKGESPIVYEGKTDYII